MNPRLAARLARPRRLDPALRAAEEIAALLAILGTIALFGYAFAALVSP